MLCNSKGSEERMEDKGEVREGNVEEKAKGEEKPK